jgi:cyclophilin family peptidyl-prolyl cis-trans isomerase
MGKGSRLSTVCAVAVLAALAANAPGCGGSGEADTIADGPQEQTAAANKSPAPPPWPCKSAKHKARHSARYQAPGQVVDAGEKLTALVRTNCGSFSIALDAKRSSDVINSFVFLARNGFYDGVPFDKAGGGRYLHGGDPPRSASGPGYSVPGKVPSGFIYRYGVVAMDGPDETEAPPRAGSQFFIVLAKPWLDFTPSQPPLGHVESGFDVLEGISNFGPRSRYPSNPGVLGPVGKLRRPVVIEEITIKKEKG